MQTEPGTSRGEKSIQQQTW